MLTIDGHSDDIIDGNETIAIPSREAIQIIKTRDSQWVVIADTVIGAAGALADDSVLPAKARAGTPSEKKAWRDRIEAWTGEIEVGRAAYAGTLVLSDYTLIAAGAASPPVGQFRAVTGQGNPHDYLIHLKPEDAHAGPYLGQFIDSPITVAKGGESLGEGLVVRAASHVAGSVYRLSIGAQGFTLPSAPVDWVFPTAIPTKSELDTVKEIADGAELDTATVINIGPEFIHNETGPKTMGINIRHPLNAYRTATVMQVSVAGQTAVVVGYDNTVFSQDTLAELSATALRNIWAVRHNIPDGMGGMRSVQTYEVGSYIPVTIELLTGRGGDVVFFRNEDVQVVTDPVALADARAAITPGPVLIINNITRFDAAQDRFEDSDGDEVIIPNGAIVSLTQAVYDAAVADTEFTPNANAIYITR